MSQEKAMLISLGSPTAESLNLSRGNPTVYGRTIKQLPSHIVPLFRIGSFSKTLVWVAWKYICRETKTCFCTEAKGNYHWRGAVASWLACSLQNERPGSSPGRGHLLYSWARQFALTVHLSTQAKKWVPASLMCGYPCDGLASHPGGRRNTPSLGVMLQKPG